MKDRYLSSTGDSFRSVVEALKFGAVQLRTKLFPSEPSRPWIKSALACVIGAVLFLTLLRLVIGETGFLSEKSEVSVTGSTTLSTSAQSGSPSSLNRQILRGVPEVIDTTTLKIGDEVIHLYGVEWARGGNADQLRRYLGDREITCKKLSTTDAFRCEVDARDLSTVVLYNGGGRTTSDAPPELRAAEQYARSEGKGVWKK
jgi:endonuclease YncB( thermonuclease family)